METASTEGPAAPQATQPAPGAPAPPTGRMVPLGALAGSVFATLCCSGLAPLVALVTAAGAGFLLNYFVLVPLLVAFLLVGAWAMWRSFGRHRRLGPLGLHLAGAAVLVLLTSTTLHGPLIWVGLVAIAAAGVWNLRLEHAYWHREPEIRFPPAGPKPEQQN